MTHTADELLRGQAAANTHNMTRHDITDEVANVIAAAIEVKTIDLKDAYALAVKHLDNFSAMVDELVEFAYSNHHWAPEQHQAVCAAADEYYRTK